MPNLKQRFNTAAEKQPLLGMLVYSFVGFLRPAIYIFLLPIYLEFFSDTEYGLYDLMVITGGFMSVIVTFKLNSAMLTQYYDYYNDEQKKRRYLSSLFSVSLFIALLFAIFLYFFGEALFSLVFSSEEVAFFPYGFTVLLYAILSEVNICYYTYLKNEKKLGRYVFIVITQILLAIILQFIFIIPLAQGVQGALLGMLIANVITTLCILIIEKGIITLRPDRQMIMTSLKFSAALIPYLLIYWVLTKGGKIVLERYADLSVVAVFALLITISSVIIMVVEAVINGIRPFLFETFAGQEELGDKDRIDLFTKMIINIPLLAIPFIILIGNNMGLITSKASYLEVGSYISLASLVAYLLVYGKLFYQQLIFVKKSVVVTRLSFLVMLLLISCFYLLVPTYKIWGVLISTAIANLLMAILFYFAAQKRLPITYNHQAIFYLPLVFFMCLFGLEWLLVYKMDLSRPIFSLIQFFLLVTVIVTNNYKSIGAYKTIFINRTES